MALTRSSLVFIALLARRSPCCSRRKQSSRRRRPSSAGRRVATTLSEKNRALPRQRSAAAARASDGRQRRGCAPCKYGAVYAHSNTWTLVMRCHMGECVQRVLSESGVGAECITRVEISFFCAHLHERATRAHDQRSEVRGRVMPLGVAAQQPPHRISRCPPRWGAGHRFSSCDAASQA